MYALLVFAVISADEYPAQAEAKIRVAVVAAEEARKAYYDKLDSIKKQLIADLQRQLESSTKRGELDAALKIKGDLERLKSEDFVSVIENLIGNSKTLAAVKESWIGVWHIKVGNFEGDWTVNADGTVNRNGKWRIDLARQKIRVTWSEEIWDDLNLPLAPMITTGSNRDGLKITAKKIK